MYVHGGKVKLYKKVHNQKPNVREKHPSRFMGFVKKMFALAVLVLFGAYIFPYEIFSTIDKEQKQLLKNMNLKVKEVMIFGNDKVTETEVYDLTGISDGDNIYDLDLVDIKAELEKHPWVKNVVIERVIPSKINIFIEERAAKAIYETRKGRYLIDDQGNLLEKIEDDMQTQGYLAVLGDGANKEYMNILDKLYSVEAIYNEVSMLQFMGKRRWNIVLKNGSLIKLPENNIRKSLEELDVLLKTNNILAQQCEIDLRFTGRKIYVKL